MNDEKWSPTEKKIAHQAFDAAHEREITAVIEALRSKVARMNAPRDLWQIEDFLREKREEFDRKYDFRYSVLLQVFAVLHGQGLLTEADLEGLMPDKIESIKHTSAFFKRLNDETSQDNSPDEGTFS